MKTTGVFPDAFASSTWLCSLAVTAMVFPFVPDWAWWCEDAS